MENKSAILKPWKSGQPLELQGEALGSGSFSKVWKAIHTVNKNLYAIKQVFVNRTLRTFDGDINKLLREVKYPESISSEFVVKHYNCWLEGPNNSLQIDGLELLANFENENEAGSSQTPSPEVNFLFIQMELCDSTLKNWLENYDPNVNQGQSEDILLHLTKGLITIHQNGLIHRDLKPANILLKYMPNGSLTWKIGDFGLTIKVSEEIEKDVSMSFKGTMNYRSPEMNNQEKYSNKTDVFSLGLIFLEVLYQFSSYKEKVDTFFDLQNKNNFSRMLVKKLVGSKYPDESEVIIQMLNADQFVRADANHVLELLTINKSSEESTLKYSPKNTMPDGVINYYSQYTLHDKKIKTNPFKSPIWIRELILHTLDIHERTLRKLLQNVFGLESFKFLGNIPNTGFSLLDLNIPTKSKLTSLTFKYIDLTFDGRHVTAINGVKNLQLWMCQLEENFAKEFSEYFPSIEYLEICGCIFGNVGGINGKDLQTLMKIPTLQAVYIGPWTNAAFNKSEFVEELNDIFEKTKAPSSPWSPLFKRVNEVWAYAGEEQLDFEEFILKISL